MNGIAEGVLAGLARVQGYDRKKMNDLVGLTWCRFIDSISVADTCALVVKENGRWRIID